MKVIIAGGRDITDYQIVCDAMAAFPEEVTEVVSGGAKGADKLGEEWAGNRSIPVKRFIADWAYYGKSAGPHRNREMALYVGDCGALVALWDGKSAGTRNMIQEATRRGLLVCVHRVTAQTPSVPIAPAEKSDQGQGRLSF